MIIIISIVLIFWHLIHGFGLRFNMIPVSYRYTIRLQTTTVWPNSEGMGGVKGVLRITDNVCPNPPGHTIPAI